MNAKRMNWLVALAAAVSVGLMAPSATAKGGFKLLAAVPDDMFLCVAAHHNEERAFLEDYWGQVFEALEKSGIGSDVMELIGLSLAEEQRTEVERLKETASKLIAGVDWKDLAGGEFVFAERLGKLTRIGKNTSMWPPDMVWLMRGREGSAAKNYDGLVAILNGIVAEINKGAGKEVLVIDTTPRHGAKMACLNFLSAVPQAPPLVLAVALRDDVIIITMGDQILDQVLGLMAGKSDKKPLSASRRFKQAFAKLPTPEDEMTFFDMQAMLGSMRPVIDEIVAEVESDVNDVRPAPTDNPKAKELHATMIEAYERGDYKQALEYSRKAYDLSPDDALAMYNLACFNTLVGNEKEGLNWLEKAVDGGFYAPKHMAKDGDLKALHGHPRYEKALAEAAKKAAAKSPARGKAELVKQLSERIMNVSGMIDYVATVVYTQGYAVHTEELTALVPAATDKPFYPVFGKRKSLTNFDRFLPKETVSFSVGSGIDVIELYRFIEDTIRKLGPKGVKMLAQWEALQEQNGVDVQKDILGWIQGETISVTIEQPFGNVMVGMLKVNDEAVVREKLASALQFLSTETQQLAQKNPMMAMAAVRTSPATHEKLPGFHNITFGMQPMPAVCGVKDGYLIFGTSADAVALCLATAAGEHPNIHENTRLMAEAVMPKGSFRSISYTDKRGMGKELGQVIGVVSMVGGMASMAIPDEEARQILTKILGMVGKLVPVVQKIDFYRSSANCCTFDGKAWHSRSVTNYQSPAERASRREG